MYILWQKCADSQVEVFLKAAVGRLDGQVGVLHGNVAGRFVEELLVALLGGLQPFLQPPDLVDVRPDLHHQLHIALAVADGGGVDHHRPPGAVGIYHGDPAAHARSGGKGLFYR